MARDKKWWKTKEKEVIPSVLLDMEAILPLLDILNRCSIPLYGRKNGSSHPQLMGSGVLLAIEEHVFILTAAHVLDLFESANFLLLVDKEWFPVDGRVFMTPAVNGSHSRDPIDAAIVDLTEGLRDRMRTRCLHLHDLHVFDRGFEILYSVSGYALKNSRRKQGSTHSAPSLLSLQGQPKSIYDQLQLDPRIYIVLESTKKVMWMGGIREAPTTTGMSGGPVFIVPEMRRSQLPPKLTAIFIERRKSPPVMIATSVQIHLLLICRFIPELRPVIETQLTDGAYDNWAERVEAENVQAKTLVPEELRSLLRP